METMNTLLYAQRAKNIVNRPVVNEDPVARLICELRAEIHRLQSLLQSQVYILTSSQLLCNHSGGGLAQLVATLVGSTKLLYAGPG